MYSNFMPKRIIKKLHIYPLSFLRVLSFYRFHMYIIENDAPDSSKNNTSESYVGIKKIISVDFELKKVLLPPPPPLGNFADTSYLKVNFKPHLLRDVCTLCSGALVSDSLLHMLL